ncbi:MAG: hypothetical protein PF572_02525 [Patescibacteria group bacterium]|jgi:hypothetical protein|nr:hypothetical protein [Patescibacteria group bacterium]
MSCPKALTKGNKIVVHFHAGRESAGSPGYKIGNFISVEVPEKNKDCLFPYLLLDVGGKENVIPINAIRLISLNV